jgi:hypothetical protein
MTGAFRHYLKLRKIPDRIFNQSDDNLNVDQCKKF